MSNPIPASRDRLNNLQAEVASNDSLQRSVFESQMNFFVPNYMTVVSPEEREEEYLRHKEGMKTMATTTGDTEDEQLPGGWRVRPGGAESFGTVSVMQRPPACAFCGKDDGAPRKHCALCKRAHYCDRSCQASHWNIEPAEMSHKKLCSREFAPSPM
jgi:hypothetical protein